MLRRSRPSADERRRYSFVFALTLEQAALSSMDMGCVMPVERALSCLPDAEAVFFTSGQDDVTPVDAASRALIGQMRRTHHQMLKRWRDLNEAELVHSPAYGTSSGGPPEFTPDSATGDVANAISPAVCSPLALGALDVQCTEEAQPVC